MTMGGFIRKLASSGWKALLNTLGVLLLVQGAGMIQAGDYAVGGGFATMGFILFIVANYS
jgi:hypothetical protein